MKWGNVIAFLLCIAAVAALLLAIGYAVATAVALIGALLSLVATFLTVFGPTVAFIAAVYLFFLLPIVFPSQGSVIIDKIFAVLMLVSMAFVIALTGLFLPDMLAFMKAYPGAPATRVGLSLAGMFFFGSIAIFSLSRRLRQGESIELAIFLSLVSLGLGLFMGYTMCSTLAGRTFPGWLGGEIRCERLF